MGVGGDRVANALWRVREGLAVKALRAEGRADRQSFRLGKKVGLKLCALKFKRGNARTNSCSLFRACCKTPS